MKYDKEKRCYILTHDEVADLNEKMERTRRLYEATETMEWLKLWTPSPGGKRWLN